MKPHTDWTEQIEALEGRKIFSLKDVSRVGISQPTFSRLVKGDVFARSATGIYYDPKAEWDDPAEIDFATARIIFGKESYIGGHTAIAQYGLCISVPDYIWVTVPPHIKTIRPRFKVIRTNLNLNHGVLDKELYRIASIERAIIDAFYFDELWESRGFALGVARTALVKGLTSFVALETLAKKLKVTSSFNRYAELLDREVLEPA